MAKAAEIKIDVKAKLSVDRKTAEACLKLVEIYVNASGVNVAVHRKDDGELSFEFEDRMTIVPPKITTATAEALEKMGRAAHSGRVL